MITQPLTLMAVHAHPDDEAIGTGGVLARYGSEGVRTVLVTCTNGELGDDVDGTKPGEVGHNEDRVSAIRREELKASCAELGILEFQSLGYRDSGMQGWVHNDRVDAFCRVPLEEPVDRLVELMHRYRPQVVITYDEKGFYGHPDHIRANQITLAASEKSGIPDKIYYTAFSRSQIFRLTKLIIESGVELEGWDAEGVAFGTPDELVTSVIDCEPFVEAKYAALGAHSSQSENILFLKMGVELFGKYFGKEEFVRIFDRTCSPIPEDDLFAGLRTASSE